MAVADGSQTRLGFIAEVTPGTIPATPAWQTMRYLSSDVRVNKQTDIPDEIRGDRNIASITDVGRSGRGSIKTNLSYGTFDDWLAMALCSDWATNVLKNGILDKTGALEWTFEQGATDSYVRAAGCRVDTVDLRLNARQSVEADFGIMALSMPTPTNAIISGATYTAATTTQVMNAALNVASLAITGVTNAPKLQSLSLSIKNNIYQNDIVGQYDPYSHGKGRFELSGSMNTYFENLDTYNAILAHSDIGLAFTLGSVTLQKYSFSIPKIKLMDGGPPVPGNGKAVMLEVPFQAYFDSGIGAALQITRAVA
jgi:hypothetical protein